jgi:DNA-binding response OmpR family regulator
MSRVLVVDDDKAVRNAIKTVLEHQGFDVVLAEDGRSGIAAVAGHAFNLVIVDIFMPGMDGLETIRAFHKNAPTVPVIAISGFSFRHSAQPAPDFLTMATKLGAAYSLHKPFRPRELLRVVEACLSDHHQAPGIGAADGAAQPEAART